MMEEQSSGEPVKTETAGQMSSEPSMETSVDGVQSTSDAQTVPAGTQAPKKSRAWMYVLFSCLGLVLLAIIAGVVIAVIAYKGAKKEYDRIEQEIEDAGGYEQQYNQEYEMDAEDFFDTEETNDSY